MPAKISPRIIASTADSASLVRNQFTTPWCGDCLVNSLKMFASTRKVIADWEYECHSSSQIDPWAETNPSWGTPTTCQPGLGSACVWFALVDSRRHRYAPLRIRRPAQCYPAAES